MNGHPGADTSRDGDAEVDATLGGAGASRQQMDDADSPAPPSGAVEVFGDRLPLARRYVEILGSAGLVRGLIGPRERPRLWDRHVLNSAAAASHLLEGESVVDIGSGAGLPGIPLALARPDLSMTLVEPLLRRVTFLEEVIAELGIDIRVIRGRAEEKTVIAQAGEADVVTSRAVAPLAKLAGWSAPLLKSGGRMVALKGESASEEVGRDRDALHRLGFTNIEIETVAAPDAEPTRLVIGTLATRIGVRGSRSRGGGRRTR